MQERSFPVDEDVRTRFAELLSSRFRATFKKRLNELGVEVGLEWHNWQHRLERVREIRLADRVEARYRFRNKFYRLEVDSGFDPGTGSFWMKRGLDVHRLYESVARQFVFKPTARPIDLFALERALELEIADTSFGRPTGSETDVSSDEIPPEVLEDLGHNDDEESSLGEAKHGHSPFTPDPKRNMPKPRPISNQSVRRSRSSKGHSGSRGSGESDSPREAPDLEKQHKEELKHDHYASHCQMCLCERPPQELAPVGSYIESEEVRQIIVHAHHADLVSAGGVRHAGKFDTVVQTAP